MPTIEKTSGSSPSSVKLKTDAESGSMIDIADAVDVNPEVIVKDYEKLTGGKKQMIKASVKKEIGIDDILEALDLE